MGQNYRLSEISNVDDQYSIRDDKGQRVALVWDRELGERIAAFLNQAGLAAENARLRAALEQIAAGNPAPPGGKWLSDAKMAMIARAALKAEGGGK